MKNETFWNYVCRITSFIFLNREKMSFVCFCSYRKKYWLNIYFMPGYLLGSGVKEAHRCIDIVLSFRDFSGQYMRQKCSSNYFHSEKKIKEKIIINWRKLVFSRFQKKSTWSEPTEICLPRKIAITFSNVIVLGNWKFS